MRHYTKIGKFVFITIALTLMLRLLLGCSGNQQIGESAIDWATDNTVESATETAFESVTSSAAFLSYCAKELTDENQICFNYPQVEEATAEDQKLNEVITEFVQTSISVLTEGSFEGDMRASPEEEWAWDHESYSHTTLKIDYEVVRNDSDYLSIVFKGLCNPRSAAHPYHYFDTLNINRKTCDAVMLTDLYRIDAEVALLLSEECESQCRVEFPDSDWTAQDVVEQLERALRHINEDEHESGIRLYMTESAVGIKVPGLPYAIGNYFTFLVTYDELEFARITAS